MTVDRGGNVQAITRAGRSVRSQRKPLIEGFKLHRVGVEIADWVDQRTWYEFGKLLQQADYAWEWMVADWLAFGDHKYGDQIYQSAARLLGKSPRTWEDYSYIARNVRISERSEILPVLSHRPVAPFGEDPALQRKLLTIAEQHGLSKIVFQAVIELYLQGKSYKHLLPAEITAIGRARLQADKERERVRKRALAAGGSEWRQYAREQAEGWSRLAEELGKWDGVRRRRSA
jgi:hypothetical protein